MRNVTLTADEALLEAAREQAREDGSTLNEQFRLWLAEYTKKQRMKRYEAAMAELRGKISTGGRRFTRDERNER